MQSDHSSTEWELKNCQPKWWKMECPFPWAKSSASTWINRNQIKENSTYRNILCLSSVKTILTFTNGLYPLIKYSPHIKKRERSGKCSNFSKSENLLIGNSCTDVLPCLKSQEDMYRRGWIWNGLDERHTSSLESRKNQRAKQIRIRGEAGVKSMCVAAYGYCWRSGRLERHEKKTRIVSLLDSSFTGFRSFHSIGIIAAPRSWY